MHFINIVIIKDDADIIEEAVAKAMGPSEDEGGFYDWFQIGGRWTGYFDGYHPTQDPCNREKCDLCNGTGKRDDELGRKARIENPSYSCNGCDGKGERTRWPTDWERHEGDVMPVANLSQRHIDGAYRVVIEDRGAFGGQVFHYRPWLTGQDAFTSTELQKPPLEWIISNFGKGYLAVVVDNHS